jgi:hypothetical protein
MALFVGAGGGNQLRNGWPDPSGVGRAAAHVAHLVFAKNGPNFYSQPTSTPTKLNAVDH